MQNFIEPRPLPGPKGLPLLGSGLIFKKDPLAFLEKCASTYGDFSFIKLGAQKALLVNCPKAINKILVTEVAHFGRKNRMYSTMSLLFGEATAISDGERWKKGFRLVRPSMSSEKSEASVSLFEKKLGAMMEGWQQKGDRPFNAGHDITQLTLAIIVEQLFGPGLSDADQASISKGLHWFVQFISERISSTVQLPMSLPLKKHREERRIVKEIDRIIYEQIDRRMDDRDLGNKEDILSQWICQTKSNPDSWTRKDLRDEIIGVFVAAHGSTAVYLCWLLYHIGRHPQVLAKLHVELDGIGAVSSETVKNLPYLRKCLFESMRMTPAGWVFSRSPEKADTLGGFPVDPDTMILMSPYLLHHNPKIWENHEQFLPDRWQDKGANSVIERTKKAHYMPFSLGKRACSGQQMALMEAMILAGNLLKRFSISVDDAHVAAPKGGFTLNLDPGLFLKVKARK